MGSSRTNRQRDRLANVCKDQGIKWAKVVTVYGACTDSNHGSLLFSVMVNKAHDAAFASTSSSSVMSSILSVTSPVFLIITLGYGVTVMGLFEKENIQQFGKWVVNIALPALLFKSLSEQRFDQLLNANYFLAYMLGSLLMLTLGYAWSRWVQGQSATSSVFVAMGVSASNSGFVGFPILHLVFGPMAAMALALNMVIENLIITPILLFMAERTQSQKSGFGVLRDAFVGLLKKPLIWGMVLGVGACALNLEPLGPIKIVIGMLSGVSAPLSLFVIGGSLVGLQTRGMGLRIAPIVVGKLLLHPLSVLAMLWALQFTHLGPIDIKMQMLAVCFAAMPMMSIYPTLAQPYGQGGMSAAAVLVGTVLSFFSLSGLLYVVEHIFFVSAQL